MTEQEYAKYFFLYKSFDEQYDTVVPVLDTAYRNMMNAATVPAQIDRQKKMHEKAAALAAEVRAAITPDTSRPNLAEILSGQAFRTAAARRGYDANAITAFYTELMDELQLVPDPGF